MFSDEKLLEIGEFIKLVQHIFNQMLIQLYYYNKHMLSESKHPSVLPLL